MSCTCLLRQSARASTSRLPAPRTFSSSSRALSAPAPKSTLAAPSICPPGTSFPWTSLHKASQPIQALEDSEYPGWLWTLAPAAGAPPPKVAKGAAAAAGGEVSLKEQVRRLRKDGKKAIKASNTLKGK